MLLLKVPRVNSHPMVSPEQFEAEALSQLLLCPPMVTQAGPSNPAKRQKQKKNAQLMRTKHAKRADEEKKLTQLEEAARDFVGMLSLHPRCRIVDCHL